MDTTTVANNPEQRPSVNSYPLLGHPRDCKLCPFLLHTDFILFNTYCTYLGTYRTYPFAGTETRSSHHTLLLVVPPYSFPPPYLVKYTCAHSSLTRRTTAPHFVHLQRESITSFHQSTIDAPRRNGKLPAPCAHIASFFSLSFYFAYPICKLPQRGYSLAT